jgi:hypothetical protein
MVVNYFVDSVDWYRLAGADAWDLDYRPKPHVQICHLPLIVRTA